MPESPSTEFLDLQEAIAGRYSLDREIGRGGMGIVFLARDVTLDRPVAIKLFPPHLARQPALRERFLNEARTAAKLSHPNIVPIHAVEEHDDLVFFVMTYIEGETLTQRIATRGPFPSHEGVRLLRDIAWALAHAHGQGIVHRDIKGDNILLENGSNRVLVTDFGIADSGREARADGLVFGTPEFMSPEQVRGESVDARSDLYSLGVVAFLVLAGRYPFQSDAPAELMARHLGSEPPRLAAVAPGMSQKLGDLIDRCLAKDREKRIDSASDLATGLGTVLADRRAVPVPVRLFVEELKRRGERSSALGVALALVMIGPVVTALAYSMLPAGRLALAAALLAALGLPATGLLHRIRRVLRAGYGREDVLRALHDDLEWRQEELAFLYGERYRQHAKRLRRIAFGALGASLLGLAAISTGWTGASPALLGGVALLGSVGAVTGLRADRRSDRKARRRLQLWKGRVGKWLFSLAGLGLKHWALPAASLTARPTELALGAAVLGLYERLPAETRGALPDVPQVVRGLEEHAQRMRRLADDCDQALRWTGDHGVGGTATDGQTPSRRVDLERIRSYHEQAQGRLTQAVAALETLRVDLLRLSAGSAELSVVTTRMGNARELAADIERLLGAQEEVQELLSG